MKALLGISILLLPFVAGFELEDIKSPLTHSNPLHTIDQSLSNSKHIDPKFEEAFDSIAELVLANISNGTASNETCTSKLLQLATDLKDGNMYSIKFLDSWGKPESGLFEGNTKWYGRYRECLDATNTTSGHEFEPQYCVSLLGSLQFQIGTCWPDTCTASDMNSYFASILPKGFNAWFICDTLSFDDWEAKDIAALTLLVILVLFVLISTLYDLKQRKSQEVNYTALKIFDDAAINDALSPPPPPTTTCSRLITSFSIIKNTEMLLDTEQKSGQIHCLHGMRFLSLAWVILGHSQLFSIGYIDNPAFLVKHSLEHWPYQFVINGTFSVDTFFFLSGLLCCYLGMREVVKRRGKLNPLLMYFLRFMRLTPAYAFCIFMSITLWKKAGEGPMFHYVADSLNKGCTQYWWTNLLYINNLYPVAMTAECYAWGWYLANDMQFYILSPLLLFLLYKYPKVGQGCTAAMIILSVMICGIFSNITQQQPQVLAVNIQEPNVGVSQPRAETLSAGDDEKYSVLISDLYSKPYTRIGAYLIGFLTGYFLHKKQENRLNVHRVFIRLGWIVSTVLGGVIIFGLYPKFKNGEKLDNNIAALYNSTTRPLWSVVMSWITIACVTGNGGPVNKFLSWKLLMPLSRLTYTCYLIHPLVLFYTYTTVETTLHMDMFNMIVFYLGQVVVTHICAYMVAMLVEFPSSSIIKQLMKSVQSSSHEANDSDQTSNGQLFNENHTSTPPSI